MCRALLISLLLLPGAWGTTSEPKQRVVDRIVARIENDILTLSELRELGGFQQLLEGRAASEDQLLRQLVEQWITATEAAAARFPQPSEADVNGELERVEKQFSSPEAYRARLRELGLSAESVRRLVERQLYLAGYLDYKFRPAAQVKATQVAQYYSEELAAQLAARGQPVPPLPDVQDKIRELLTQREITARATRWLDEMRSRLRIETALEGEPR